MARNWIYPFRDRKTRLQNVFTEYTSFMLSCSFNSHHFLRTSSKSINYRHTYTLQRGSIRPMWCPAFTLDWNTVWWWSTKHEPPLNQHPLRERWCSQNASSMVRLKPLLPARNRFSLITAKPGHRRVKKPIKSKLGSSGLREMLKRRATWFALIYQQHLDLFVFSLTFHTFHWNTSENWQSRMSSSLRTPECHQNVKRLVNVFVGCAIFKIQLVEQQWMRVSTALPSIVQCLILRKNTHCEPEGITVCGVVYLCARP